MHELCLDYFLILGFLRSHRQSTAGLIRIFDESCVVYSCKYIYILDCCLFITPIYDQKERYPSSAVSQYPKKYTRHNVMSYDDCGG